MFILLVAALLGLGFSASISPLEIAEARQRCSTQCIHLGHVESATCMRECWAKFFADRKGQHRTVGFAAKSRHPGAAVASPPVSAAAAAAKKLHPVPVKKAAALSEKRKAKPSHKMVHPLIKGGGHGRSKLPTAAAKKKAAPVAPFSHARHRGRGAPIPGGAIQHALASLGALIVVLLIVQ